MTSCALCIMTSVIIPSPSILNIWRCGGLTVLASTVSISKRFQGGVYDIIHHRFLHHSLWAVCCTFLSKLLKSKCLLKLPARARSFLNKKAQYVTQDIGCGMMAVRTTLTANQLPDSLKNLRTAIEQAVPHGRTHQVCNLWCCNLWYQKCYCEIIYYRKYQQKVNK